ncbi:Fanconi-associated nuclease 1 [Branchiostoma belcheri]|nr:Fanconi-associated nuclease 1 [Branchiostoma belcheri]
MSEDGQVPRKRLSLKSRKTNKRAKMEDTDKKTVPSKPSSSSSTSNNSIMSAFARQKTPTFAHCPVCDKRLPISWMNSHLDNGCLQGAESEDVSRQIASQGNAAHADAKCADAAFEKRVERKDYDSFEVDTETGSFSASPKCSEGNTDQSATDRTCEPMGSTSPYFKKTDPPRRPSIDDEKLASMNLNSAMSSDSSIKEDGFQDELSREDSATSLVGEDTSSMEITSFDVYKSQSSLTEEDTSSQSQRFMEESIIDSSASASSVNGDFVDDSSKNERPGVPYYLQNFTTVVASVLDNDDDRSLFNEEDMTYVETFREMDEAAQKLYVRLFQRKFSWHRQEKLQYPEIAEDLKPVCQVLVREGFLQNERDLTEVKEVLQHLSAPDLKTLAKSLHIPTSSLPRAQLVQSILNHGKVQRTIFGDGTAMILKRARKLLGGCVRLTREARAVFTRVLLLFNLSSTAEEEEKGSGGQQQLQTILMVKMGKVTYPDFTINRPTKIFNSREDLLRYEQAMQFENDITVAMETNKFQLAHQLYLSAAEVFSTVKQDPEIARYDAILPPFLRCYTASWVYTGVLSRGVEVYEKLRRYGEAVDLLNNLLSDSLYCPDSHGRWYDRLALNLESHLKQPEEALRAILRGLADPQVRSGHRLALMIRAHRLCDSNNNPRLRTRKAELPPLPLRDLPKVTITGRVYPVNQPGYKNVFITTDSYTEDSQDVTICSVEELSLAHYRGQGYEEGIHGEGSTYWTLCLLLLWDVVFMEGVADVFRSPYQSCPLDRYTDDFYTSRRAAIDSRLEEVRQADSQTLQDWVSDSWTTHEGQACAGLNWDRFTSVEHAQGLVACTGGQFLAGVFARLLRDARHCRSGLPDLTVWSTVSRKFKVVEVKGPGDRLSQKQMLWLDYFLSLGAQAEVCHVVATGAKKLKKTSI